jgi:hypothetical protein
MVDIDDDDSDDDKTPTASPLAKKHPSSEYHINIKKQPPRFCPECLGDISKVQYCNICDNRRYTDSEVTFSTWELRKTLADYNKTT